MKRRLNHFHYVGIAFATVLFWRGVWNLMDRIPGNNSWMFDALTGAFGLLLIWYWTRSFKHLD